jgi:hypothetical protein
VYPTCERIESGGVEVRHDIEEAEILAEGEMRLGVQNMGREDLGRVKDNTSGSRRVAS